MSSEHITYFTYYILVKRVNRMVYIITSDTVLSREWFWFINSRLLCLAMYGSAIHFYIIHVMHL